MQNGNVLMFINPHPVPKGYMYVNENELWILHEDYKQLSLHGEPKRESYSIEEFHIDPKDCQVFFIGNLIRDKVIYISILENGSFYGLFLVVSCIDEIKSFPRHLMFSLSSLLFHRQIMASFVPYEGAFCVVSKEGFSIHSYNMRPVFFLQKSFTGCCFYGKYLLVSDRFHQFVYELKPNSEPKIVYQSMKSSFGTPYKILSLSHCLVMVYSDGNKVSMIQTINFSTLTPSVMISMQTYFESNSKSQNIVYDVFDDSLIIMDRTNKRVVFLDVFDSAIVIGNPFRIEGECMKIVSNSLAVIDSELYRIETNYGIIKDIDLKIIASLFRRSNAISYSLPLLINRLKVSDTVEKLIEVVSTVGSSATTPVAQVRFCHALQFGSIVDPHLILIGLLEYYMILKERMIDEAKISLINILSHPSCCYTSESLLSSIDLKLNSRT